MLNKQCYLSKKDQLWVVLHHDCIFNQKYCGECSYLKPPLMREIETDIKAILYPMVYNLHGTIDERHIMCAALNNYLQNLNQIQEYRVTCDETNNINSQIGVIDVLIKEKRSMEYMKLSMAFHISK